MNSTYKNIVLWVLAYSSCYFCLNPFYKPSKIIVKRLYNGELNKLEKIEVRLANDPIIKFIIPILFYELPIIFVRLFIFYSYKSISWQNLTFLLKNVISVIITFITYLEISKIKVEILL